MDTDLEQHSILDDLGAEVTGIAFPVSLCMAITIALVRLLHRDDDDGGTTVAIAEAVYTERSDDSAGNKLRGSLLNALVFVAIITLMTFVIVLLFKYGCVKIIYGYMGFATFMIFFFMTGGILLDVLQTVNIHIDAISVSFLLYNFSVVGSTVLFFTPAPLLLKQGYLMWTGVVVAYIFTSIPAWTTWVLLVAMALYDLFAVLTPHGPLQLLVNLAVERDQEIPALVYEAREVRRPRRRQASAPPATSNGHSGPSDALPTAAAPAQPTAEGVEEVRERPALRMGAGQAGAVAESTEDGIQIREENLGVPAGAVLGPGWPVGSAGAGGGLSHELARLHRPPVRPESPASYGAVPVMENGPTDAGSDAMAMSAGDAATESLLAATEPISSSSTQGVPPTPLVPPDAQGMTPPPDAAGGGDGDDGQAPRRLRRREVLRSEEEVEDPYDLGMPSAVKLGLGDFIFYSVLVGRASLYDWMTVYSSFISVIAGLGITLWLLAVAKKALPALPVSIALGVLFYFLTRATLEPFITPAFTAMVAW
eukprot:jgi/Ulvmu1/1689/UM115_0018.1